MPLRQDEDVLDTWFSSALWPFSTLGWPEQTPELEAFYPTSVLVTGFDIIFFWVARMIMMGLKFTGDVPFREVYITGLIRDEHGDKMSKSKGNIIDPLDLIDGIDARVAGRQAHQRADAAADARAHREGHAQAVSARASPSFGTDALRFTFAALATPGRDIRFDLGRVEGYRNFCNKLWNAARYVLNERPPARTADAAGRCEYSVADRWIRGRLRHAIGEFRARPSPPIASISPPRRCTNSPGTSSATGTWSSRSPCCNPARRPPTQQRGTRRRCSTCSRPCCACCTR